MDHKKKSKNGQKFLPSNPSYLLWFARKYQHNVLVYPSLASEFQQKAFNSPVFTSFLGEFMVHGVWQLLGLPNCSNDLPASHPLLNISQSFRVAAKGHKCKRGKTESPKDMLYRACITGKPGFDYNGDSTSIQFYTSTRTQHAMYII